MYSVYILANTHNTVLYTGVTNHIERRLAEHRSGAVKGFSKKYNLWKLVYLETTNAIHGAIAREKQIKGWLREKKDALVMSQNPAWDDLGTSYGLVEAHSYAEHCI